MCTRSPIRDALPRPSPDLRRIVAIAALSVVAAIAGAGAQSPAPPTSAPSPGPVDGSSWIEAVDAYAAGRYLPASQHASTLDAGALLAQGRRDAERWQAERSPDARRRLRAAAALAFELGLGHHGGSDDQGSAPYIELGETTLRVLERSDAASEAFGAVWRLAQLHLWLIGGRVTDVDGRARREDVSHLSPQLQAEWHLARGIGFEASARMSLGKARVQQTPFGTADVPRQLWIDRNRRRAMEHYRTALGVDGTHREAHLRLGRVLFEIGQHAEARPHLEQAAAEPCAAIVCGLGWLFLGEWHLAHGTPEGARRAFVRASRVLDVRQSALLGLLRATLASRPASALEITRQFTAQAMLGQQRTPDAWSRYLVGHPFGLSLVIEALREEVAR